MDYNKNLLVSLFNFFLCSRFSGFWQRNNFKWMKSTTKRIFFWGSVGENKKILNVNILNMLADVLCVCVGCLCAQTRDLFSSKIFCRDEAFFSVWSLGETEALRALVDRLEEVRSHLVVRFVNRQVELIKTKMEEFEMKLEPRKRCKVNSPCMCWRQAVGRAIVAVNLELLSTVHALERSEALERNFRCAGDELKELGTFGLIEAAQRSPEPLNLESHRH